MKKYMVVTEAGDRFIYDALGVADAVNAHYATDKGEDDFPLVVGAFLIYNGWVGLS